MGEWEFEPIPVKSDMVWVKPVLMRVGGNWFFKVGSEKGVVDDIYFHSVITVKTDGKQVDFLYPTKSQFYVATEKDTNRRVIVDEGAKLHLELYGEVR